ncbi:hypothetical protein C8R46DRAFT_1036085 [Mycena filopes]|nr:hypothetical protein C8R46DRAFT_1036085 [Mycena filopes]
MDAEDREFEEPQLDHHQEYTDPLNKRNECEATLIDSPGSLPKSLIPTRSWPQSTGFLRPVSLALHSLLIAIHVGLLVVWSKNLEQQVVFSLDRQRTVSFILTAVTTTCGTTYSAVLVFMTQTLFTRRSLGVKQTLTAIHDSAAAWVGIGSAVMQLWGQTTVHGSTFGVLSALAYLANILVLHITTPALFSVVAFNSSHNIQVGIEYHMPITNGSYLTHYSESLLAVYMKGSLALLPWILSDTTPSPGLHEATLYDVLDSNEGVGNVTVNATGFNVTCGYPPFQNSSNAGKEFDYKWWRVNLGYKAVNAAAESGGRVDNFPYWIPATLAGMIRPVLSPGQLPPNLPMYSTMPIVDSSNTHPPLLKITPAMENSTSKTKSVWAEYIYYNDPTKFSSINTPTGNEFIDLAASLSTLPSQLSHLFEQWSLLYAYYVPQADFSYVVNPTEWEDETTSIIDGAYGHASVADVYLLQTLNITTTNSPYFPNKTVTLHDLENALSRFLAALFWTSSHVTPASGVQRYQSIGNIAFSNVSNISQEANIIQLARGTKEVGGILAKGRLEVCKLLFDNSELETYMQMLLQSSLIAV